jgi:hypothetical protein
MLAINIYYNTDILALSHLFATVSYRHLPLKLLCPGPYVPVPFLHCNGYVWRTHLFFCIVESFLLFLLWVLECCSATKLLSSLDWRGLGPRRDHVNTPIPPSNFIGTHITTGCVNLQLNIWSKRPALSPSPLRHRTRRLCWFKRCLQQWYSTGGKRTPGSTWRVNLQLNIWSKDQHYRPHLSDTEQDGDAGLRAALSSGLQPRVRVPTEVREYILRVTRKHLTDPLETWTSSDPCTHQDLAPNWGAGMPEKSPVISLTGHNHNYHNW